MLTHRQRAKRTTVLWQGAAVGLLAAAGAAAAFPQVRDALAPKAAPTVDRTPGAGTDASTPTQPSAPPLQIAAVAEAMGKLSNFQPTPPPPPKVEEPVVADAPPPPVAAAEWAYVGSIITPAERSALVRIDTAQTIMGLNESYNDVKLVVVEPDHIEIEKSGGPRQRIDLAERVLLAPTDPPKRPVAFRPTPNPVAPGAPNQGGPNSGIAMARPMTQPAPSPATFEQARAAAIAAREAAKAQPPVSPPVREDSKDMPDIRDLAVKVLSDENSSPAERVKILTTLGIRPGMPVESALELARKHGLEINKGVAQAIERMSNGEGKGEFEQSEQKESK